MVVGECSISEPEKWFLPYKTGKTVHVHTNTTPTEIMCLLCFWTYTLKCLSIGTPKIINFPFVSNEKLIFFRGPNIQAHYNEAVLCLNFGTTENNEFSIWDKWKIYYF